MPLIQPTDHRVLLRRVEREFSTVVLTDAEASRWFQVVACGPGKKLKKGGRRPMDVKPGDIVHLPGCGMDYPDWVDVDHIMVTEDDIGFKVENA